MTLVSVFWVYKALFFFGACLDRVSLTEDLLVFVVCMQVFTIERIEANRESFENNASLWAGMFPVIGTGAFFALIFQVEMWLIPG